MSIENERIRIRANISAVVDDLTCSKNQFFREIRPHVKKIKEERERKKFSRQQLNIECDVFNFYAKRKVWNMRKERKCNKFKGIGIGTLAGDVHKCEIPTWLPPIHKQYVKRPERRDFFTNNFVKTVPLSEICKSRYLRVPDDYTPDN